MEKLRKRLAIFFGCLSAIFASIAIYNHIRVSEISEDDATCTTQKWNRDIEQYARKNSKLIFFSRNLNKFKPSKTAKKILDQYYISVELSPDTYPGDYFTLDTLLTKETRKNHINFFGDTFTFDLQLTQNPRKYRQLEAGILSPNLHPVYLTSQSSLRSSNNAPTLNEALELTLNHFEKNPYELRSNARNATTKKIKKIFFRKNLLGLHSTAHDTINFDSLPQSFFSHTNLNEIFSQINFMHAEIAKLYTYFKSKECETDSHAIVSENSRLALKILELNPNQIVAEETSKIAIREVCNRYDAKGTSVTAKLLYLRAMGDSSLLKNKKSHYSFYIKNVKSFIPKRKNNDTNFGNYKSTAIRDLALMTSVFAKAYSISSERKFLKEAEKLALLLENKIQSSTNLPAKIGVESEASSLEYVLCARAFFDLAKHSKNNKWIQTSFNTISKWNDNFMTDISLWSINSKKSVLAKYARPIITRDSDLPSYIGEASQLFAELGILNNRTGQILKKISISASIEPLLSHNWASLKLAMLHQHTPPNL